MTTQLISIDGNIGAGKSHIIKKIRNLNNPNIYIAEEPVNDWEKFTDENNKTLLNCFYENQDKYSFSFQMIALITRIDKLNEAILSGSKYIITERSILTDYHVFAEMLYDDKLINKIEFDIYRHYYNFFSKTIKSLIENMTIIYINTPVDICHERIKTRNRLGEETISKSYLNSCDSYHKKMIEKCNNKVLIYNDSTDNVIDDFIKMNKC